MDRRALSLSRPLKALVLCLALAIIDLVLIGMPGPCSFSGYLGDALAKSESGFFLAIALVYLPILRAFLCALWWVVVRLVRSIPG